MDSAVLVADSRHRGLGSFLLLCFSVVACILHLQCLESFVILLTLAILRSLRATTAKWQQPFQYSSLRSHVFLMKLFQRIGRCRAYCLMVALFRRCSGLVFSDFEILGFIVLACQGSNFSWAFVALCCCRCLLN